MIWLVKNEDKGEKKEKYCSREQRREGIDRLSIKLHGKLAGGSAHTVATHHHLVHHYQTGRTMTRILLYTAT